MAGKQILRVDAEVASKIEENRGDMTQSEFISFLIDGQLEGHALNQNYVDKEEFYQFAEGMKGLLRNFFEFALSHGLELGKQPKDKTLKKLEQFRN